MCKTLSKNLNKTQRNIKEKKAFLNSVHCDTFKFKMSNQQKDKINDLISRWICYNSIH